MKVLKQKKILEVCEANVKGSQGHSGLSNVCAEVLAAFGVSLPSKTAPIALIRVDF